MSKKIIIFSVCFFFISASLCCNNKRIRIKAYVPTIITIETTKDDKLNVKFNNDEAYYNLSNEKGLTKNYHEASFFNLFMN